MTGLAQWRRTRPDPARSGDNATPSPAWRQPAPGHPARGATAARARTARPWHRAAWTLLLALLAATCLVATPAATRSQAVTPTGSPAALADTTELVELPNGHQLFIECRGSGGPTVILEAGYRSPATVWTDDLVQPDDPREMVFAAVATFTRVCLYERPGVAAVIDGELIPSRSAPVPMPRPVESVVTDLHLLLDTADVPGPYVLVGHSLGGLMMRLYAATYPEDVAGMVLVDPFTELLQQHLTPGQWQAFLAVNAFLPPEMAAYPDYETIDFAAASASMAAAPPLPPLPLIVIARALPLGVTEETLGFDPDVLETAWRAMEEDVAALSPLGRLTIAEQSAHYVQLDEPEVVINAIGRVVTATREPGAYQPPPPPE